MLDEQQFKIISQHIENSFEKEDILNSGLSLFFVNELIKDGFIVSADFQETGQFYPHRVDIETVSQCNARCTFCPQSISPKPNKIMSMGDFEKIMDRLKAYNISNVAINHYGEPLLDPYFKDRVDYLTSLGIPLLLYTNGILLKKELVDFLNEKELLGIVFNVPSMDPEEWSAYMQVSSKLFARVLEGLRHTIATFGSKLKRFQILVNGTTDDHNERTLQIRKEIDMQQSNLEVVEWESNSRAGIIENDQVHQVWNDGDYFAGCDRVAGHLHIGVDGNVFLCCQDYHQEVGFGNLLTDDLESIVTSDYVSQIRAEIYGSQPMRKDLICKSCVELRTKRIEQSLR